MLVIRQETQNDYKEVYNVIKKSFETAEHSDGTEQDLVVALRKSKNFVPELSLVAVLDNKIVGYILFTKINIGTSEELALAPLGILPDYQKRGIGSNLIKAGHKIAKDLGYNYSVVLGENEFYSKFGYIPAIEYNIKSPFEVENEYFMATKLIPNAKSINGTVKYAKEFGI